MTAPTKARKLRPGGEVVDLSSIRELRRREIAERRIRSVLDGNRAALSRLFATGLIFTQKGSRAARDLLRAHQSLLRTADLFARLVESHNGTLQNRGDEVLARLDPLLARTSQLTARTGEFLAGRGRE
ncbi:MAG: hypothetical protein ACJ78T_11600 [Myxococcales bacterium]